MLGGQAGAAAGLARRQLAGRWRLRAAAGLPGLLLRLLLHVLPRARLRLLPRLLPRCCLLLLELLPLLLAGIILLLPLARSIPLLLPLARLLLRLLLLLPVRCKVSGGRWVRLISIKRVALELPAAAAAACRLLLRLWLTPAAAQPAGAAAALVANKILLVRVPLHAGKAEGREGQGVKLRERQWRRRRLRRRQHACGPAGPWSFQAAVAATLGQQKQANEAAEDLPGPTARRRHACAHLDGPLLRPFQLALLGAGLPGAGRLGHRRQVEHQAVVVRVRHINVQIGLRVYEESMGAPPKSTHA